jgi:hypothetical protein
MMVAAGFGICFIPEFSPTIPGVLSRLVCRPGSGPRGLASVDRRAALFAGGRRFRSAVPSGTRSISGCPPGCYRSTAAEVERMAET